MKNPTLPPYRIVDTDGNIERTVEEMPIRPLPVYAPPRRGIRLVEALVLAALLAYFLIGILAILR